MANYQEKSVMDTFPDRGINFGFVYPIRGLWRFGGTPGETLGPWRGRRRLLFGESSMKRTPAIVHLLLEPFRMTEVFLPTSLRETSFSTFAGERK